MHILLKDADKNQKYVLDDAVKIPIFVKAKLLSSRAYAEETGLLSIKQSEFWNFFSTLMCL
jgi:hypothetical protein